MVDVSCPRCGSDPVIGSAESFGGAVVRRALACPDCGWLGKMTTTLVRQSDRDLDHLAAPA